MALSKSTGGSCWNCSYKLRADHVRCPRCGIPVEGRGRPTASAAPPAKGRAKPATTTRRAKNAETPRPRATKAPAASRVEIIPPGPPAPSLVSRLRTSAGHGLLQSLGIAKRVGSVTAEASRQVVTQGAKLLGGTATTVSRTTNQIVARMPQRQPRARVDVDAMRLENARTLAGVAELLLRETREENAALLQRIERLEEAVARQSTRRGRTEATAGQSSTTTAAPARTRSARGPGRTSAKSSTAAKRVRRRPSPSQQEGRASLQEAALPASVSEAPILHAVNGAATAEASPVARRNGVRRRTTVARATEPAS